MLVLAFLFAATALAEPTTIFSVSSANGTNNSTVDSVEGRQEGSVTGFVAIEANDEARLITKLITKYHGFGMARPVADVNKTLDVSMLFVINEFLGIDELTGTMTVTAMIIANWHDDLLRWDPEKYHNLRQVPMKTHDIFLPVIVKDGNGGTQSSIFMTGEGQNDRDVNSMVWVDNNGFVESKIIGHYQTSCSLDLTYFPFDSQTCKFNFKSWRFNDKRVTLHRDKGQLASEIMEDSAEVNINANPNWEMNSISSADLTLQGLNGEQFSSILYTISASRRSDYYTFNVLLPCFSMAILLIATFFMPFGPDRSIFCITMVLTLNLFQQALSNKLPTTAGVIPFVRQTNVQVFLSVAITIESAVVWWVAAKDKRSAVPRFLRSLVPELRRKLNKEYRKDIRAQRRAAKLAARAYRADDESVVSSHPTSSFSSTTDITKPHLDADGEELIVLGEWLEVAQFIDLIMLGLSLASIAILPIIFYRNAF